MRTVARMTPSGAQCGSATPAGCRVRHRLADRSSTGAPNAARTRPPRRTCGRIACRSRRGGRPTGLANFSNLRKGTRRNSPRPEITLTGDRERTTPASTPVSSRYAVREFALRPFPPYSTIGPQRTGLPLFGAVRRGREFRRAPFGGALSPAARPRYCRSRLIRRLMSVSSWSTSTGLVTCSSVPAARLRSRSPGAARAVTAMIGRSANSG